MPPQSRTNASPRRATHLGALRGPVAANWDGLLIATAMMILTYVWRLQELHTVFQVVPVTRLATVAALMFWAFDSDPRRTLARTLKTRVMRLILALVGVLLLSVPTGIYPTHSLEFVRKDYLTTFFLLVLVAGCIRTVRDVERLVLVHLCGALVYSTWTFTQERGVYYDTNDFSLLLAETVPFAVFFLRPGITLVARLASFGTLIFFVNLIIKTDSRGGFLALMAVMLYILVRFRAIRASVRVVAAVAGVGTMLLLGSDEYWTRMQTILHPTQDYNWVGGSSEGRMEIWKRGMGYMVSRPFGVGVRQFGVAEGFSEESLRRQEAGEGFKWSVAHSSYVQIGAELGVLGLAVFVLLLANAIKTMASLPPPPDASPRDARAAPALGQALAGAVIAFAVGGAFLTHGYQAHLYALLGMVIGTQKLVSRMPNAGPVRSRRTSTAEYRSRASAPFVAR